MRQDSRGFRPLWTLLLVLVVPLASRAADQALPDQRLGIPTAPVLLLSRPEVVADLNLTPEQRLAAEQAISRLYSRAYSIRGKTGPAILAVRKLIDTEQIEWLEANLSEKQRERLFQIELQWEGASALVSRPILSDTLRLTTEQKNLLSLAKKQRDEARKAKPESAMGIEAEWSKEALTVLNEGQRVIWKSMLGHPLAFQLAADSKATAKK